MRGHGRAAHECAAANLFGQGHRGGIRLHPQFVGQRAFADLELGQGSAAFAAAGQHAHGQAVGFFVQGIHIQDPARLLNPFIQFGVRLC